STENKLVLNGLDLTVKAGQIHAIMGPNGSGKSSLALTLMGHPAYSIEQGSIIFNEKNIEKLSADNRAKQGIFLSMQYPIEIEGIAYKHFLRQAYDSLYHGTDKQLSIPAFYIMLEKKAAQLNIGSSFLDRSINVGFSGGEKKRAELLQLAILQPKLAILDEIDSGLDIDALKLICNVLKTIKEEHPDMAIILITHYQRILNLIAPDTVHILQKGKIIQSGDMKIARQIEESGYQEQ
ncbi:MAG: Fe-S cluster assembly ATPase SufC, partial [bacterium]